MEEEGANSAILGAIDATEFRVTEEMEENTDAWSEEVRGYVEFDELDESELK